MTSRKVVLCTFVISVLCAILAAAPAQAQGNFIRGDVDCDGAVTGSDTTMLTLHLYMAQPINCRDAADLNDNGSITSADLLSPADSTTIHIANRHYFAPVFL